MLLIKAPVPEPSTVLKFAVVGFAAVLQQIPRAVTAAPPSAVTFPPPVAVVPVMAVTAAVPPTIGAVATGGGGGGGAVVMGVDFLQPAKNNMAIIAMNVTLIFIKKKLGRVYICNDTG